MFQYQYLPGQSKDCIDIAEDIFSQLKKQGVTRLPSTPEEIRKFIFSYNEGEMEDTCVFFILEEENVGYFKKTIVTVHGTAQYDSAKFYFAN